MPYKQNDIKSIQKVGTLPPKLLLTLRLLQQIISSLLSLQVVLPPSAFYVSFCCFTHLLIDSAM